MPGQRATINGAASVLRVIERAKRLMKSAARAEGERKASLEAELAQRLGEIKAIKEALAGFNLPG